MRNIVATLPFSPSSSVPDSDQDPRCLAVANDADYVGIDTAREDLKELLAEEAMVDQRELKVVAIVGLPGSGKTVLATAMYNSQEEERFELKAWVWAAKKNATEVLEKLGYQHVGVHFLHGPRLI
ncbi:hypothetical protein PR202_gn00357 [Eleusine coracana subsp. coracana]|uniref:NB-ARC domain-containing protein n=1 Tax=Eleusine coracana subsp. coracana TaxID=191504 RepID=A0AAV5G392_ELECO|nr:hypothetical protein PR202_gn00357 [Eleusine coracana subsp. coracana]